MEGGKRRTGPVRRVERSFECSRLAELLLISAYERVVPVIRHPLRREVQTTRMAVGSAENHAPAPPRMEAACP